MAETLDGAGRGDGTAAPLPDSAQGGGRGRRFPYSNWGPWMALFGVLLALATGLVLAVPVAIVSPPVNGKFGAGANVAIQFATELGFLMVPMLIAARWGAASFGEALRRLGVRRFRLSGFAWMAAAYGAYLLFFVVYVMLVGVPHQEQIADQLGPIPAQIALIVVAAPLAEEVCFRGMLFGGLRERLPRLFAVLITGVVFGGLHASTGLGAVPPLIVFGAVLALLYEKTGSIVPAIFLHALNNSLVLLAH